MNELIILQILNAVLTVGANATITAQKIRATMEVAAKEGRPVSDGELAALAAESDALTELVRAELDAAAGKG